MRSLILTLAAAATVVLIVGGCGGSNGGPGPGPPTPTDKGVVQGQVYYFDRADLPVTGVQVMVGTTAVLTANSTFKATMAPGTYTVTVTPPEGFATPPGASAQATAVAGQVTTIAKPFYLFALGDLPPGWPSG
jgi:hypothetical protein